MELLCETGTQRILGANMIGPHATEIIHEIALAVKLGTKASEVAWLAHAHPSVSEAIMDAAQNIAGGGH